MIKRAERVHTSIIEEMWAVCFPQESVLYNDFFFRNYYSPKRTLIFSEDNRVKASLQRYPHEMMMNGRILQTSMIVGVATFPEHQGQGCMNKLMEKALDQIEHQELITWIQAYNPDLYKKFGFEMVIYHNELTITADQVKKISNKGCSYDVDSEAMMKLYASFVRHFNGFYIRDKAYFDTLKKSVEAQHGKVIAYYNDQGELEAYGILLPKKKEVVLEECIYLNTVALMKLVNLALQHRPTVRLHTSDTEGLSVLFPTAQTRKYGAAMARVNDIELFNRLYGTSISTVKEAFASSGKPLYLNEFL